MASWYSAVTQNLSDAADCGFEPSWAGRGACVLELDALSHTAHNRGRGLRLAFGLVTPPSSIHTVKRFVKHGSCFSVRGNS